MHNSSALEKKELEQAFAEDFSSPIFPILGELYLKNKDLNRAKKVCQVGLKHDPENINGYYILAKVYLYDNQLNKAEEMLITLIDKKPLHINALKLIVKLHEELTVTKKNKIKYLKILLDIFPTNKLIEEKITKIDNDYLKKNKPSIKKVIPQIDNIIQKNINFNIQPNMATLTFVEILKEQKHYHEALQVLSIVESKSTENKKTKSLKNELQKLLTELQ